MIDKEIMRMIIISGARPQFIKLAPIIRELKNRDIDFYHIHSGQHYDDDLSRKIFEDLEIPEPDINLQVGSGSHAYQTAKMMEKIEREVQSQLPDIVLVAGDTNSTLAGAISAIKLQVPVVHLEAGLRSHDWNMPEEINRILVDRISSFHITTSQQGLNNLISEGFDQNKILLSGDPMVDSLYFGINKIEKLGNNFIKFTMPSEFILCTLHRAENVDNKKILTKFLEVVNQSPYPIILPLHPRTKKRIQEFNLMNQFENNPNLTLMGPVGYLEFLYLHQISKGIMTDSGGLQKEAFILKKPCITLRTTSEWVESIKMGANRLLGFNVSEIVNSLIDIRDDVFQVSNNHPYGDGTSAKKVIASMLKAWDEGIIKCENNLKLSK